MVRPPIYQLMILSLCFGASSTFPKSTLIRREILRHNDPCKPTSRIPATMLYSKSINGNENSQRLQNGHATAGWGDLYRRSFSTENHILQSMILVSFYGLHTKLCMTRKLAIFPGVLVPCDVILGGIATALILLRCKFKGHPLLKREWNKLTVPWRRPRQHPMRTFFVIISIMFFYH